MNLNSDPIEIDPHLPDISQTTKTSLATTLDRVGMRKIEVPLVLQVAGETFRLPALLDAFVNLRSPEAKGIHMSRLYRDSIALLPNQSLSFDLLTKMMSSFVEKHEGLSTESELALSFELPLKRKALLSEEVGWRHYPVHIKGVLTPEKGAFFEIDIRVLYSSTCPCSAALSRRLVAEKFIEDFKTMPQVTTQTVMEWLEKEESIVAVPHSQRSEAFVQLKVKANQIQSLIDFVISAIDLTEKSLGTPVQSAVKRVDEQEFARLNGTNLMFCEDAARKLKIAFSQNSAIEDFRIEVQHRESLHAHDAVAIATKNSN